jgi:hypothetical protein
MDKSVYEIDTDKSVYEIDTEEFLEGLSDLLEVDGIRTGGRFYKSKLYIIKGTSMAFYFTEHKLYWIDIDHEGNLWSCDPGEVIEKLAKQLTDEQMNKILFNLDIFK